MNASELWWQTLADGPVLLALFDADERLRQANAAFRAAWALAEGDTPTRAEMVAAASAAGTGPADPPERRERGVSGGHAQTWRDGRRLWWVEQPTPDGGRVCTGVDISALQRPAPVAGEVLGAQQGRELLQSLLSDPSAWPLCVAIAEPDADVPLLLARIRGEDVCARLADGRLLLMLPSTGPAQAAALVGRLGRLVITEARWGESATELLLRA